MTKKILEKPFKILTGLNTTSKSSNKNSNITVLELCPPTSTATKTTHRKANRTTASATSFYGLTRSDISTLISKIGELLLKGFVSCVIWFVLGEFCPALREKLPDYYAFVDAFLEGFNEFFHHAIEFLKWGIHILTFGHF